MLGPPRPLPGPAGEAGSGSRPAAVVPSGLAEAVSGLAVALSGLAVALSGLAVALSGLAVSRTAAAVSGLAAGCVWAGDLGSCGALRGRHGRSPAAGFLAGRSGSRRRAHLPWPAGLCSPATASQPPPGRPGGRLDGWPDSEAALDGDVVRCQFQLVRQRYQLGVAVPAGDRGRDQEVRESGVTRQARSSQVSPHGVAADDALGAAAVVAISGQHVAERLRCRPEIGVAAVILESGQQRAVPADHELADGAVSPRDRGRSILRARNRAAPDRPGVEHLDTGGLGSPLGLAETAEELVSRRRLPARPRRRPGHRG